MTAKQRSGSIPVGFHRQIVRVVKEEDLKSSGYCPRRFKSCICRLAVYTVSARVAQLVERRSYDTIRKPKVEGS